MTDHSTLDVRTGFAEILERVPLILNYDMPAKNPTMIYTSRAEHASAVAALSLNSLCLRAPCGLTLTLTLAVTLTPCGLIVTSQVFTLVVGHSEASALASATQAEL